MTPAREIAEHYLAWPNPSDPPEVDFESVQVVARALIEADRVLRWGIEHLPKLGMSGQHTLNDAALIAEFRNRAIAVAGSAPPTSDAAQADE